MESTSKQVSLGTYLASRLVEVGCRTAFAVPGDFTLTLLDQLLAKKQELQMVWNSNELCAGYAADGYARINGIGACCVTFCVGGFSAINAIAGAYAEDLPVIVISGGPNSNDYAADHILHHTVGVPEFGQQLRAYREVTCAQVVIQHLSKAHHQIDYAISEALRHRKPAYIEICCNLAGLTHPSFLDPPVPFALPVAHTNQASLKAAVEAAAAVLGSAAKPVLLSGPRLRANDRRQAFQELAKASKYAVAVMPDGKGMYPEDDESFVGVYWGSVSWPYCMEVVEASDVVISVGCVWTDYSTVGYSLLLDDSKQIKVEDDTVTIKGGQTYGCVAMEDFLRALAAAVEPNTKALEKYKRMADPHITPADDSAASIEGEKLTSRGLYKHVQAFLAPEHVIVAEVGDALFQANKLHLPRGAGHEIQLRYGSIGWSVGAVLGASLALQPQGRRVLGLIGDGSFQMTAQDVSTMLRFGATPVIILINNGGYAIESEIHDGEYNVINNWDYTKLIQAMDNGTGRLWTPDSQICNETQLAAALEAAAAEHSGKLCFIEVVIDREDTSPELLEWGARVAAANARPPKPQ